MNQNKSYKHLSFEERCIIEEYLNLGNSIHAIARRLKRSDSSIVREIKRNRYVQYTPSINRCKKYMDSSCTYRFPSDECLKETTCHRTCCRGCNVMCNEDHCDFFIPYECPLLLSSPFVCNGCKTKKNLSGNCYNSDSARYRYNARKAEENYRSLLRESRDGINLSPEDMLALDELVSPLLKKGQSIHAVFINHCGEIPRSQSTVYKYVDRCYLTARNVDLPRKVRFKHRNNHGKEIRSMQSFTIDRTYNDFKEYTSNNPELNIWEMDTVIGTPGGKCLLTLLYRKSTFMIAILLDSHTQDAVINALNSISNTIGINEFQKLFQIIITDRGLEFGNPYALECDQYGEIKTKVFYCDPYCSWQKGMIEKNHEFIRMILPKGKSFEHLTQKDIQLMMNHINNYPRESLNGCTPYELSKMLLGQKFLLDLKFYKILPDDVILKEKLLKLSVH